ncbi:MAG: hypothetical protein ABJZ69_14325, partial [Hyphomicrobiales bacterium]
ADVADGAAGALLPLQLLLSSAFATSAKRIYQVRLKLGPAGIAAASGAASSAPLLLTHTPSPPGPRSLLQNTNAGSLTKNITQKE